MKVDRRRFLVGSGGTLALPLLESLLPRAAYGQTPAAPRRLVILLHQDGRIVGNGLRESGVLNDHWSPGAASGALPATGALSPMLGLLEPIRNEVVTIDGIDNRVRHTTTDVDGHRPGQQSILTCKKPVSTSAAGGPSFDHVLGTRLRASTAMRASVVIPATAADATWRLNNSPVFFGANGSSPTLIHPDPKLAIKELFGAPVSTTPMTPTLAQRMVQQRTSMLDGVLESFNALKGRVSASDRQRLEAHAEFVRAIEQRSGNTGGIKALSCTRPTEANVPGNANPAGGAYLRGERDAVLLPHIVENLVQTIACDVTRVASLFFWQGNDPVFPTEFPGVTSPFQNNNWHTTIHATPRLSGALPQSASDLKTSFNLFARTFVEVVQRLGQMQDVDGSRLLDNTLVLWISDMGYGPSHAHFNVPVVMAGLKSKFSQGQGRHVVVNRRSTGDLFAEVMRMFGGTDATFGDDGTIGQFNTGDLNAGAGAPGFITSATPLHSGPIGL
jgi:Protein of unknown function (DUF1552)